MEHCDVSVSYHGPRIQRNQTKLVCGLLLWVFLLTISQVLSITLLLIKIPQILQENPPKTSLWPLTSPQPPQNHVEDNHNTTQAPKCLNQTTTPHQITGPDLDIGQIVAFEPKATGKSAIGEIKWKTQDFNNILKITDEVKLTINLDGNYFLYLQVTLEVGQPQVEVVVNKTPNIVLLVGRTTNHSLSTGFLGRALKLSAKDTLTISTSDKNVKINTKSTATYLGIILLKRI